MRSLNKPACLIAIPIVLSGEIVVRIFSRAGSALAFWSAVFATISVLYFILAWCRADAKMRAFPWPQGLSFLIVGLAAVGVPYYLFRSRGWGALRSLILCAIYLSAVVALLSIVTAAALSFKRG